MSESGRVQIIVVERRGATFWGTYLLRKPDGSFPPVLTGLPSCNAIFVVVNREKHKFNCHPFKGGCSIINFSRCLSLVAGRGFLVLGFCGQMSRNKYCLQYVKVLARIMIKRMVFFGSTQLSNSCPFVDLLLQVMDAGRVSSSAHEQDQV